MTAEPESGGAAEERAENARAQVREIAGRPGHVVDNARAVLDRLERAFAANELRRTPALAAMIADLDRALEMDEGQRLGGKSAEAARFILKAIDRALDQA